MLDKIIPLQQTEAAVSSQEDSMARMVVGNGEWSILSFIFNLVVKTLSVYNIPVQMFLKTSKYEASDDLM